MVMEARLTQWLPYNLGFHYKTKMQEQWLGQCEKYGKENKICTLKKLRYKSHKYVEVGIQGRKQPK